MELDDVFLDKGESDEDETRPSQDMVLKKGAVNIDNLINLSKELTNKEIELPLIGEMEDSDSELPWKDSR